MAWYGRFKGVACGAALACVVAGSATGLAGETGQGQTAVPSCVSGTAAARPTQAWAPGQPRSAGRPARTPEPATLRSALGQPRG